MQHQQLHILLVDDDANERSGVRFLIEQAGFPLEIWEAPNGKKALELLRRQSVNILFTDVKMPYMDGLELSATVYKEFPQIKIIVFSAYGEFEYAKKAMEAKAVNYLLKPVDVDEFNNVLRSVIRRCQEEKILDAKRQRRIKADRKLAWINLLNGKLDVTQEIAEELGILNNPNRKEITLIHLEAQGNFFALHEQEILHVLERYASCSYEYLNLYPNSSYILIMGNFPKETLQKICCSMVSSAKDFGDCISVLIDDSCFSLHELAERVQRMDDLRHQLFIWDAEILFLPDLIALNQKGFSDVEVLWNQTRDAVDSQDKQAILESVQNLLDTMKHQGLFSSAYIHHIFCDLLGKLYTQYGYTDHQGMRKAMRRLSGCRSKQALMELMNDVLKDAVKQAPQNQDASYAVHRVKRIIQKEFGSDLSLDYLADHVGLAPAYLSYVFKRETGENIIKYLTDFRMEQAKEMLDSGIFKISQIAKQCGYESPSYFNRLFKNAYGMTPSQYREKQNGK